MERATRAMRKAVRTDSEALDKININNIQLTIEGLINDYKIKLNSNANDPDDSFMLAALSYIQQDYAVADDIIAKNDQSQSTINLRKLIQASY